MLLYYIFNLFLVSSAYAEQGASKSIPPEDKKPLVLQWEISHARNTDQISLIFRQETVELVTNTSFKTKEPPRLGSFSIPRSSNSKILEKRIYQYYIRLKNTIPIASLIKGRKTQPPIHPHAPMLYINDQKIHHEHIYFKPLKDILFQEIKNKKWNCQECATYKLLNYKSPKTKKQKTIKKEPSIKIQRTVQKNGKTTTQAFTKKEFNCRTQGKTGWECVDPEFGIFVLKKAKSKKEISKQ